MNDLLNELKQLQEKYRDALHETDTSGYIHDAISDVEFEIERQAQERVDQGITRLPEYPRLTGRELGVTR
jgi:hypothetical protein